MARRRCRDCVLERWRRVLLAVAAALVLASACAVGVDVSRMFAQPDVETTWRRIHGAAVAHGVCDERTVGAAVWSPACLEWIRAAWRQDDARESAARGNTTRRVVASGVLVVAALVVSEWLRARMRVDARDVLRPTVAYRGQSLDPRCTRHARA